MDRRLKFPPAIWLGLTLAGLVAVGLMARIESHPAAALPVATEALAAGIALQPALVSSAEPSPAATEGIRHRRTALSMPYFSFARLLRPGS